MIKISTLFLGSFLTIFTYKASRVAYRCFPYFTKQKYLQKKNTDSNSYIVIAGATDGIGKAFAKQLTARNYKTVTIGRNPSKLQELRKLAPELVTPICLDLSQISHENKPIDRMIQEELRKKYERQGMECLGVINCVGIADFDSYEDLPLEKIIKIDETNINSLHLMLKTAISLQSLSSKPRQIAFVNLSSASSHHPLQYSSVYAGTKAYMTNLLKSYRLEEPRIEILDVQPWYVTTKLIGNQSTWDTVPPEQIVEGSLRVLGKTHSTSGCLKHQLIDQFLFLFTKIFKNSIHLKYSKVVRMKELLKAKGKKRGE